MSTQQPQFSEEELRAIEAEMQKITVDDVLLQTIVTLLNVGARKAGPAPPPRRGEAAAPEPDLEQVRQAVDAARALLPLVEAAPRRAARPGQGRAVAAADVLRPALRAARRRGAPRSRRSPTAGPGAELRQALGSGAVGVRAAPRVRLRAFRRRPGLAVAFRFDLTQRGSPCPIS